MFSLFLECKSYQTLSNGDRKNTYMSATTVGNRVGCDNNLGPAWFRFQGGAGQKWLRHVFSQTDVALTPLAG